MTKLEEHQSASTTKMLNVGDPGGGKTGALASLAKAGYNLRIIDLDNGLDILANLLRSDKEALARVEFETVTDRMRNVNGKLLPAKATVWNRAIGLLQDWNTDSAKLGPITSWGAQDILVIDSLTHLGKAALFFQLAMNARLGGPVQQSDWYQAQMLIEGLCQTLFDDGVKCNVIVNCHVKFIGEDDGPQRGYPETATGKALSPKIGSYFNSIVMTRTSGQGQGEKHRILTRGTGGIELKTSAPGRVKAEYSVETGLAEYFKDVRGEVKS